ncbi:MAG TPA: hypothetical protein VF510_04270 [Ktedonobacterales bacterium]
MSSSVTSPPASSPSGSGLLSHMGSHLGMDRLAKLLWWLELRPRAARMAVLGAWGVSRLLLFAGLLIRHAYCDPAFYHYAGQFALGRWPYRDVQVEYPPIAMLLLILPALPLLPFQQIAPRPIYELNVQRHLTHLPLPDPVRYGAYGISFGIEMLLVDALTLWLVCRAARRLVPGDVLGLRSGLLYIVLVFLNGALLQKFDLVIGALGLAAVVALVEDRRALAGVALALATLVKGFPLLAAPVVVGYYIARSRRIRIRAALEVQARHLRSIAVAFAAVLVVCTALIVGVAGWQPVVHTIFYHADRGTEIESIYATVIMALGWIPGLAVHTAFNREDLSRVVVSPLSGAVGPAFILLTGLALLAAYVAVWQAIQRLHGLRRSRVADGQIALIGITATFLAFLVMFRALPLHYLLAVLPLAAVIRLPQARLQLIWLAALLAIVLFGEVGVSAWDSLVLLRPWAVGMLVMRNIAWLVAYGVLIVALWQWPSAGRMAPQGV